MFFRNDDATTEIVVFICAGPHFLILNICLLYMDASHKPAIYLRFTVLVAIDLKMYIVPSGSRFCYAWLDNVFPSVQSVNARAVLKALSRTFSVCLSPDRSNYSLRKRRRKIEQTKLPGKYIVPNTIIEKGFFER